MKRYQNNLDSFSQAWVNSMSDSIPKSPKVETELVRM